MIIVIFLVILTFLAKRTTFGRHVYAVGGNAEAARRAGINVPRIRILVFMISSSMAAVGGIILAANVNSVDPNFGGGTLLLDSISAAVIGGTSLFGGRGEVRTLPRRAVIATVSNGLNTGRYPNGTSTSSPASSCCWPSRSTPSRGDCRSAQAAKSARERSEQLRASSWRCPTVMACVAIWSPATVSAADLAAGPADVELLQADGPSPSGRA